MNKLLSSKFKYLVLIIYAAILIICLFALPLVKTNYDLAKYLPNDSNTKQALNIIETEFGYPSVVEVMINDVEVNEVISIKNKIKEVKGVKSILWLDDVVDLTKPIEHIDQAFLNQFYLDKSALINIQLDGDVYSLETELAIKEIKSLLITHDYNIRGQALINIQTRAITANEMTSIMIVIIPLCILILVFSSTSYLEPVLILLTLGVSILLNMGSNIFLDSISFITLSMASVLQLAMSMDYSIFLIHRYYEEKESGKNVVQAVIDATKQAFKSITASALTTIMGFVSLLFMRYAIGADIGIVLAKGVFLSFITVITLLPVLIIITAPLLEKLKHRSFIPSLAILAVPLNKLRFIVPILLVVSAIIGFNYQRKVDYVYGDNQASQSDSVVYQDMKKIESKFGLSNPIVILIPIDELNNEISLVNDLLKHQLINNIQSIVTIADQTIPINLIPSEVKSLFVSNNYHRLIVNVNIDGENEMMFEVSDYINKTVSSYYNEYYLAGAITSTSDIKNTILSDSLLITLFSIAAIAIIILLLFKSWSIPIILVGVIQTSIYLNMAIPYFQNLKLAYIGYLIVSSLQLGATIDYAVLLSSRYLEFRINNNKLEAIKKALEKSSASILISSLVLAVAGFAEGILSSIGAVKDIGILVGRGAVFSCLLVVLTLPPLLLLLDKFILKTTKGVILNEKN